MDQQPPNQNQNQYQYESYNPSYPQGPGPGPYQHQPYPPMPAKTNTKSIVGLVFGILSIMIPYIGFFLGIVAIIVSSLSFKEIRVKREQGKGLSIAGLVCGIIGTVLYGLILLIVVIGLIVYVDSGGSYNNNFYSNF